MLNNGELFKQSNHIIKFYEAIKPQVVEEYVIIQGNSHKNNKGSMNCTYELYSMNRTITIL